MKTTKKRPIIILIAAILYAAVFVIIMAHTILLPSRVYDNQALLSSNLNSSNKINYRSSRHDGITTVTCDKMQGMYIVWEYKAGEDVTRQMHYNFAVTSGKAKLVLIQPDDTVITLAEQDSAADGHKRTAESNAADNSGNTTATFESMMPLDLKKGTNRIKIVCGKGTAFSLSFEVVE